MATYTIGYFCYLCNDKNEIVKQKSDLLREAQLHKSNKHIGRADVCFEEYNALKDTVAAKTAHIKEVSKQLKIKPIYMDDYSICGIEIRGKTGYECVAGNYDQIKELAEQYIIESIILGHFEDIPRHTDSK